MLTLEAAGGLEADHVYRAGLHAGLAAPASPSRSPTRCCTSRCRADDEAARRSALRQALYVAITRARVAGRARLPAAQRPRRARSRRRRWRRRSRVAVGGASGTTSRRSCSAPPRRCTRPTGCCATSCSRATMRAGGRLAELRFDTDLDVSHAVVRYLELLKLAALIARPEGPSVAEALRDVNVADPAGGHRRAARDLRDLAARRLPARRRARRAPPRAGDRRARRAVAGAVPADARRRASCCRRPTSTPTGRAR